MRKTGISYIIVAGFLASGFSVADTYDEPIAYTPWISAANPKLYGFPADGASVLPGMPYYQSLRGYWESHDGALPEDHLVSPIANIILPQAGRVLSLASGIGQGEAVSHDSMEESEGEKKEVATESYHNYNVDAFMEDLTLLLDAVIPEEIKREVYKLETGN